MILRTKWSLVSVDKIYLIKRNYLLKYIIIYFKYLNICVWVFIYYSITFWRWWGVILYVIIWWGGCEGDAPEFSILFYFLNPMFSLFKTLFDEIIDDGSPFVKKHFMIIKEDSKHFYNHKNYHFFRSTFLRMKCGNIVCVHILAIFKLLFYNIVKTFFLSHKNTVQHYLVLCHDKYFDKPWVSPV